MDRELGRTEETVLENTVEVKSRGMKYWQSGKGWVGILLSYT